MNLEDMLLESYDIIISKSNFGCVLEFLSCIFAASTKILQQAGQLNTAIHNMVLHHLSYYIWSQ